MGSGGKDPYPPWDDSYFPPPRLVELVEDGGELGEVAGDHGAERVPGHGVGHLGVEGVRRDAAGDQGQTQLEKESAWL